jgi:hypothetical protein
VPKAATSSPQYFLQQTLLVHPFTAPIWLTGLFALLFSERLKPYRMLGFCYLTCFTVFFVLHGKNYYLGPVYPMLLAAGAVVIESALDPQKGDFPQNARPRRAWLKTAIAALIVIILVVGGAHAAPQVVPILPVDRFITYLNSLPFKPPVTEHSHARILLPQWYADQFGWEEIVAETAQAWNRIPIEDRKDCGIFAQDYGQAGAIDFLGRRYGLPASLSGHQTWFPWGPRGYSGNCMIVLDDSRQRLEQLWDHVEYVGQSDDNPYALEKQIDVYICRGSKFGAMADLWPQIKRWR